MPSKPRQTNYWFYKHLDFAPGQYLAAHKAVKKAYPLAPGDTELVRFIIYADNNSMCCVTKDCKSDAEVDEWLTTTIAMGENMVLASPRFKEYVIWCEQGERTGPKPSWYKVDADLPISPKK